MNVSVLIATFGDTAWREMGLARAAASVEKQDDKQDLSLHFGWDRDWTICTSRNALASRASGDWLCFLDADDELAPGFVGAMRRALEQEQGTDGNQYRLLFAPAVRTSRNGRPFFYPERDLKDANWLPIGTLISRDLFWQVGGFDERDPHGLEDWSLWTRAAAAGAVPIRVPSAVYVAHQRRSSHAAFFRRDRAAYMREYHRIRREAWPNLYEEAAA